MLQLCDRLFKYLPSAPGHQPLFGIAIGLAGEVNHSKKANATIWSDPTCGPNPGFLTLVATRSIGRGEDILIDFGDDCKFLPKSTNPDELNIHCGSVWSEESPPPKKLRVTAITLAKPEPPALPAPGPTPAPPKPSCTSCRFWQSSSLRVHTGGSTW